MTATRVFLTLSAVSLIAAAMPQSARAASDDNRSNIVLVFIDDMG